MQKGLAPLAKMGNAQMENFVLLFCVFVEWQTMIELCVCTHKKSIDLKLQAVYFKLFASMGEPSTLGLEKLFIQEAKNFVAKLKGPKCLLQVTKGSSDFKWKLVVGMSDV